MPIKRSALRQLRKDKPRTLRNQATHSELKTIKKRILSLITENPAEAKKLLPTVMRKFDQAAARGRIHRNAVSRLKSRLSLKLAAPASK